jgi:DNA invertase Pin-like site-specific DNA recombinase
MRAAIYCRLSKRRTRKKANVRKQQRNSRDFIDWQVWQLVDVYAGDGIGATDTSRVDCVRFPRKSIA